ncbi:MAG: lipopolysaccharide heptosyltransferase I [Desulfobulbaceae bacterium DB1]|nr:MAG: lipopolysaccharide heptosyltransferase I [Desulfobulbaceae bacterium DB1]
MHILIVKTSAIGDVTHTLPALHALRRHYPAARIDWLIEEAASGLIVGHPALDRLLISKRRKWMDTLLHGPGRLSAWRELTGFIRELRSRRYDLVIDFQGLLKSGIFVGLSRGRRKIGFGRGMDHAECSYLFLNEKVPPVDMNIHAVRRELLLLEAIGVTCDEVVFDLPLQDGHFQEIAALLRAGGIDDPSRVVPINPQATWPTKLWDNGKFAQVGDWLADRGLHVVYTGGRGDKMVIDDIITRMRCPAINLAGETSLKTLAALYKKAPLVISTDTGPMHIAAAVNTPVVAVFGSTAPWRTGPFGERHQVVRLDLPCSPCLKKECRHHSCMEKLPAEAVIDAVQKILSAGTISCKP